MSETSRVDISGIITRELYPNYMYVCMSSNMRNNEELLLQYNWKNEDSDVEINMKLDKYRNLYDTHNIIMGHES